MTKKFLLITAAVILTFASCKGKPDIMISENNAGKPILAKEGNTISIELKSQISTGFSWRLTKEPVNLSVIQEEIITLKQIPGAPEIHKFLFKAEKKGTEKLDFSYARHWLKNSKPAKTYEIQVEVK